MPVIVIALLSIFSSRCV